jgi:hypothetical protein
MLLLWLISLTLSSIAAAPPLHVFSTSSRANTSNSGQEMIWKGLWRYDPWSIWHLHSH